MRRLLIACAGGHTYVTLFENPNISIEWQGSEHADQYPDDIVMLIEEDA